MQRPQVSRWVLSGDVDHDPAINSRRHEQAWFGPLPGYNKGPLIGRSAGLLLSESCLRVSDRASEHEADTDRLMNSDQVVGTVVSVSPMLPSIPPGWRSLLKGETRKPYYRSLNAFLEKELAAGKTILPDCKDIFNALAATSYDQVRVLLVGQDPYPTPGHAHGLCFSVQPTVRPLPLSLRNVYRELHEDVGCRIPNNGYLEPWAMQGVLMLNTVLTVRARQANSHQGRGWEQFTDRIIELVAAKRTPVVFVLWGRQAQKKRGLITQSHHTVIATAHPSPLSVRKFFGCRCFSHINRGLADAGLAPIDWQIPDV